MSDTREFRVEYWSEGGMHFLRYLLSTQDLEHFTADQLAAVLVREGLLTFLSSERYVSAWKMLDARQQEMWCVDVIFSDENTRFVADHFTLRPYDVHDDDDDRIISGASHMLRAVRLQKRYFAALLEQFAVKSEKSLPEKTGDSRFMPPVIRRTVFLSDQDLRAVEDSHARMFADRIRFARYFLDRRSEIAHPPGASVPSGNTLVAVDPQSIQRSLWPAYPRTEVE